MKETSVLFVDDDINVLSSLKRGLLDEDYKAFFAASGEKALAIMEENQIGVIVTDMRMPGMDGLQLLKKIKDKYPGTIKMVLSGYTQLPQILATINQVDIFKFITKPWNLEEELKPIIRQAVEYYCYLREKEEQKDALEKRNALYQNILRATDEKFLQNKNDFENIREINKFIFNTLKAQADPDKNTELLNKLNFLEELYIEYLKVLPTNTMEFLPERLEIDLNKWLNEHEMANWVEIKKGNNTKIKQRGNYILIYYIVTTMFKYLLPIVQEKGMDLSIEVQESILTIEMLINRVEKSDQTAIKNTNDSSVLFSYLKEICKTIDSGMSIQKIYENPSIKLKIPVQAV